MIEIKGIKKRFGDIEALGGIDASIEDAKVFGLIGTNGAGKSTLLKLLSGIIRPDAGEILVDERSVYENTAVKEEIFYISDELYFFMNASPKDMIEFYVNLYPKFDRLFCKKLLSGFGLDGNRRISTYSKGMKKQLSVILGLSAGTKYLLCDETFDGLDPVMRQTVKSLFAEAILERGLTPVIASHNLREMEDICDHAGLLHQGGIIFSKDIDDMKLSLHKLQCVFKDDNITDDILKKDGLDIVLHKKTGSIHTFTVRGGRDEIINRISTYNPIFQEIIPLSLEEIFISETEVQGYDIKALVL